MKNLILEALKNAGIKEYRISISEVESAELFFVKKRLDLRRRKKTENYRVTVFNVFEKGDKKFRGSSDVLVFPGMEEQELTDKFKSAYLAAGFVFNPYYELTGPYTGSVEKKFPELEEGVKAMSEALFAADNDAQAFLNSAELFVISLKQEILTSKGTDVSYNDFIAKGEFVAQCKEPQDVETYMNFSYAGLETEALTALVKQTLEVTKARAAADTAPKAGNMRVMISGRYVKDIFSFFLERADAGMIYPGYSNYKTGMQVQGEKITGEKLNISLKAAAPFSSEGIPMKDRELLEDGSLKTLIGGERFSQYLKVEPTGSYGAGEGSDGGFVVKAGKTSLADMKKQPYLNVVNFSDFQVDSMNGHFGGEIRLAFYFDGEKEIPVTGGSISGNLFELAGNMELSAETQTELRYRGPFAVCFENINVAGR